MRRRQCSPCIAMNNRGKQVQELTMVTERERYFFDLNGYLLLKGALSTEEVAEVNAGIDALLFVDALCHGSAERINSGDRRIIVYRYGPSWGNFRHGYRISDKLAARLKPERLQIVRPKAPLVPKPAETSAQ